MRGLTGLLDLRGNSRDSLSRDLFGFFTGVREWCALAGDIWCRGVLCARGDCCTNGGGCCCC